MAAGARVNKGTANMPGGVGNFLAAAAAPVQASELVNFIQRRSITWLSMDLILHLAVPGESMGFQAMKNRINGASCFTRRINILDP